jgi:hypothetical protein
MRLRLMNPEVDAAHSLENQFYRMVTPRTKTAFGRTARIASASRG